MHSKYEGMVKLLIEELMSGKYTEAEAFPSERVLMKRYRVARGTVRRALGVLHERGLLQRCCGQAAIVTCKACGSRQKIGMMITGYSETEIFRAVREELVQLAKDRLIEVVPMQVNADEGRNAAEAAVIAARRLVERGVDGVILQPVQHLSASDDMNIRVAKVFARAGVGLVLIDCDIVRKPRRSEYDLVTIDNFNAGRIAAEHVVACGAKKIVFVTRVNCANTVLDRWEGVRTVQDRIPVERIRMESMSDYEELRRGLDGIDGVDAVICQNDGAARNVATVLRKRGKRIPTDVMVVGFDDQRSARNATPGITSIRQPCGEIARHAFELLLERLKYPKQPPIHVQCRESLVVRASTERSWRQSDEAARNVI